LIFTARGKVRCRREGKDEALQLVSQAAEVLRDRASPDASCSITF
jgi:hypothetical protein